VIGLFTLTDRQLGRDQTRKRALELAIAIFLAIGWAAWMLFARVNVYATTDQARVEVAQHVFYVQAPLSGRVTKSNLALGRQVEPGDVLVELEADPEKLKVQGEETHHATLEVQLANLREELGTQQSALAAEQSEGQLAVQQARASLAEARETERMASEEVKKKTEGYSQGITPQLELDEYKADYNKKKIELRSAQAAVNRAEREEGVHRAERQAVIEGINSQIGAIQGELAASANTAQQLEDEVGWHQITAAGRGRLDETVDIKPGSYIREGDRLAVIVPQGQMRIVAYFEPRAAIGRVKPGQMAWLRLDGFPWQEYGSVTASVKSVGSEARDGRVRVELDPQYNSRITLQHGLPGTLEVLIDRVSPGSLLLRKTGGYLAQPVTNPPAAPTTSSQVASQ
jgi:multidrug resistance efflux pump